MRFLKKFKQQILIVWDVKVKITAFGKALIQDNLQYLMCFTILLEWISWELWIDGRTFRSWWCRNESEVSFGCLTIMGSRPIITSTCYTLEIYCGDCNGMEETNKFGCCCWITTTIIFFLKFNLEDWLSLNLQLNFGWEDENWQAIWTTVCHQIWQ